MARRQNTKFCQTLLSQIQMQSRLLWVSCQCQTNLFSTRLTGYNISPGTLAEAVVTVVTKIKHTRNAAITGIHLRRHSPAVKQWSAGCL